MDEPTKNNQLIDAPRTLVEFAREQSVCSNGGLYASGETPVCGDLIEVANRDRMICREVGYYWIVMSVCDDMVRAKCEEIPEWKQAFFTKAMRKVGRV